MTSQWRRRLALALVLAQLLLALFGVGARAGARPSSPAVDVAVAGAQIARLPERAPEVVRPSSERADAQPALAGVDPTTVTPVALHAQIGARASDAVAPRKHLRTPPVRGPPAA